MHFRLNPSQKTTMHSPQAFLLLLLSTLTAAGNNNGGAFTFDLIPRDAPSLSFRIQNATAAGWLHSVSPSVPSIIKKSTPLAQVYPYLGNHLMKFSLGTPPFNVYAIADTGSNLIWTQCVPCPGCYRQNNRLFNPQGSSSYEPISCSDPKCQNIEHKCSKRGKCEYSYMYGDSSLTKGLLSVEKLTVTSTSGRLVAVDMTFGCGHNDSGTLNDHEMGIVGLGAGPQSFVSQIAPVAGGRKMMSQCLMTFRSNPNLAGRLQFGSAAGVSGPGVLSMPMAPPYVVTLNGISVGRTFVPCDVKMRTQKIQMLMDSGTAPIYLPRGFRNRLVAQVRKQVRLKAIKDDPDLGTELCYMTKKNLVGPNMTFHFDGAYAVLTPAQLFMSPPPKPGVYCLAVEESPRGFEGGIYGSFAQSNFLIGFDPDAMKVSLKPADCTKLAKIERH